MHFHTTRLVVLLCQVKDCTQVASFSFVPKSAPCHREWVRQFDALSEKAQRIFSDGSISTRTLYVDSILSTMSIQFNHDSRRGFLEVVSIVRSACLLSVTDALIVDRFVNIHPEDSFQGAIRLYNTNLFQHALLVKCKSLNLVSRLVRVNRLPHLFLTVLIFPFLDKRVLNRHGSNYLWLGQELMIQTLMLLEK